MRRVRKRVLAAYDIRDPKRLRRVHRLMKGYGYALQYSVFVCDLSAMERVRMVAEVSAVMHLGVDSLVLIDLGRVDLSRFQFVGTREHAPPDGGAVVL